MLREILNWDLERAPWFFDLGRAPLPGSAMSALQEFWAGAEFAEISRDLRLPHRTREEMVECWLTLLRRRDAGSFDLWQRIARASRQDATVSPVSAAITSLYALAWWEGYLGPFLFEEHWPNSPYGLHPGWTIFPVVAAQNLLESGALWAARRLAQTTIEAVENSSVWNRSRDPSVTAECRATLRRADRRYAECVENLAGDLRQSCRTELPNFRAEVAALFWSLGDVPHAEMLRRTHLVPSQQIMTGLVRRSMQIIHLDPGIQHIWLSLRDRPPFALREHRELFVSINLVWSSMRSAFLLRGEDGGQHVADLLSVSDIDPSRAYAHAIIEHCGSGIGPQALAQLAAAHAVNRAILGGQAPEALLRIRALLTLLFDPAELGSGKLSPHELWVTQAEFAARLIEERERDGRDAYDRRLDIPFYYLDRGTPTSLTQTLEITERYRAAGLWYWRRVWPFEAEAADPESRRLATDLQQLIKELRGNLFLRTLRFLPPGHGRIIKVVSAGGPDEPVAPTLRQICQQAVDAAEKLADEFDAVTRRLTDLRDTEAPRRWAPATVDDFVAGLTP